MQTKKEHLRKSILIPLLFALTLFLSASIASLLAIQRLDNLNDVNEKIHQVEHLFPALLDVESDLLSAQIDFLKEDIPLKDFWSIKDREQLLQRSAPIFKDINRKYNVTHFYFIDLEQLCFLRVHNPGRYGDFINRATMNAATRKVNPVSGIELGPLGTFTLRVVHPWYIDGKLTGYIELGKEIHHITPIMKRSLGVDLIFTIDKNYLQMANWKEGMKMLGRETEWDLFPNSVVIDSTIDTVPLTIGTRLGLPHMEHSADLIKISQDGVKLRGKFLPLIDAAARDVGEIVVLLDVTGEIATLTTISLYVIIFYLILGLILFLFMFFLLGITEEKLDSTQQELISEIEERTEAQNELQVHRDKLELLVQERTEKLNESLSKLKEEVGERELAEQALRLSEAQFRGVFESSALGITISDIEGHIINCNPAYQNMLGYSEEELQTMTFSALTHSEDVEKQMGQYRDLIAGKLDFFQAEKRYISKEGRVVWGQLTVSLIRDENEQPLFVIGLIEDIGEKKLLEGERLKASKLESIGILAGGIAHDFNNLLTAIVGNIALAKRYIDPQENAAKRLQEAEKALMRTRDLTQQLLTFSKGGEPVRRTVSITDIIRDSCTFALRGSNVKCQLDIAPDLWNSKVDTGQLSQVIQNLAINADQSMSEGGTVTVTASNETVEADNDLPVSKGRYVKISIADNGKGIPAEVIPKIFDPYFTTKEGGSGLGLSIVHSIINNHDGHIQVESQPGAGSTFLIYLPASKKKSALIKDKSETNEEMIRDFAAELLNQMGYTVELAGDGEEAVALYTKAKKEGSPFDLVLMDITVPGGMGGKEAVKKILIVDEKAKVIVSSGYAKDPIMSNYKQYGFSGVVPKPYSLDELGRELNRVIKK
jgi:PAS domain S-box-containing protein